MSAELVTTPAPTASTPAKATTYLMNPVSGEVVHIGETFRDGCAGSTLFSSYTATPRARGWLGINGEPFVRLTAPEAAYLRSEFGYVCTCEMKR